MNTEGFLNFWHTHLNTIIGFLMASVFLLLGVYLFLEFVKEKKQSVDGEQGTADFDRIEESLKKLLENTQLPKAAASGGESAPPSEEVVAELEQLKNLVGEKDALIKNLEEAQAAASENAGGVSPEIESKIADLEARLAEYEIIEDDIADLSMYKEENSQLKKEIEALKAGGAAPEAAPVEEAPAPTEPEPVAAPTDPTPEPEAAPEAEAPAEDTGEDDDDWGDDIMAEFAAAVQEQKTGSVPPVEKGSVPEESTETTEESAAAESNESSEEGSAEEMAELENLIAESGGAQEESSSESESAAAPAEPAPEPESEKVSAEAASESEADPEVEAAKAEAAEEAAGIDAAIAEIDLGPPDTDKMLGELEALNATAADDDGEDALSGEVDTDKMLGEVDELNAVNSEESEQAKLAGEFDNFVKES